MATPITQRSLYLTSTKDLGPISVFLEHYTQTSKVYLEQRKRTSQTCKRLHINASFHLITGLVSQPQRSPHRRSHWVILKLCLYSVEQSTTWEDSIPTTWSNASFGLQLPIGPKVNTMALVKSIFPCSKVSWMRFKWNFTSKISFINPVYEAMIHLTKR